MNKITDEYGNQNGSIEKRGEKYIIKDNYGFKEASVEKDLLSDNYCVYDNLGQKQAKIEKDFIGKGLTIKNKVGRTVGRIEPASAMGTGPFIALLVLGILFYISFDSIPENLQDSLNISSSMFLIITVPNLIFLLYNVFCIIRKKGFILSYRNGFLMTLVAELYCGAIIFLGACVIVGIIGIIEGEGILTMIVMTPMMAIFFGPSALVEIVPISLVCSIVIKNISKRSE